MPPRSRNEHLVPDADKPYYRSATVVGLRQQLDDEGLDTDGLKYDLYLRLVNAGFRLYTDDRPSSDGNDSDGHDDQGDEGRGGSGRPPRRPDGKRLRDPSPSDDGGGPQPPPRRRRGLGLPVELQIPVIQNLHPAALWNLIDSAPEEYLSAAQPGGINALVVEARGQYALDYPPPIPTPSPSPQPDDAGQDDGDAAPQTPPASGDPGPGGSGPGDSSSGDQSSHGSSSSSNNNSDGNRSDNHGDDDEDNPRTMSLLEWVSIRATYDSRFRTANRTRINRVIDAYLAIYGPNDPAPGDENKQEDMLYFFRNRDDLQNAVPGVASHTPLTLAAVYQNPIMVQLLLLRGAPVDQSVGVWRPLDRAFGGLHLDINGAQGIQCIFTLIGSGANLGVLRPATQRAAFNLLLEFDVFDDNNIDIYNPPMLWPKIDNPRGVGIREFIADERSSYWDRVLLSMYVIWAGTIDYPLFV